MCNVTNFKADFVRQTPDNSQSDTELSIGQCKRIR